MVVEMAARYTQASTEQQQLHTDKPESSKRWLARQLLKPVPGSWQSRQPSIERPRTAPPTGIEGALAVSKVPAPLPISIERPSTQHGDKTPPRPPRVESGVVRDVNAWLDASNKPASPLMGGLPYWRLQEEPSAAIANEPLGGQYAIPISETEEKIPTLLNRPLKSFCRRAKKIQVRMPSLRRTDIQQATVQKRFIQRSTSTPLLAIPYEAAHEGPRPVLMTRYRSMKSRPAIVDAHQAGPGRWAAIGLESGAVGGLPLRRNNTADINFRGPEYHMERQSNTASGQSTNAGHTLRIVPSAAHMPREDSMGSLQLSDAPTYFTGPAPPSYRSRAASIVTTSSFGCIDGMNPEQRQLSQQRAQRRRGMKRKLKKLAQKALFTK